jgi:hypothetical protein
MDMYKFGLAVKELMAVVNEQTRKQTSSVLYTKYSKYLFPLRYKIELLNSSFWKTDKNQWMAI